MSFGMSLCGGASERHRPSWSAGEPAVQACELEQISDVAQGLRAHGVFVAPGHGDGGGHSEVAPVVAVEVVELAQVALGDELGGVLGEGKVGVGDGVQMDLRQTRVEDGADLASGVGAGGAGHSGADDGDR